MKRLILDLWLIPGLGPVNVRKIIAALSTHSVLTTHSDRKDILEWVYSRFPVKGYSPNEIIERSGKERDLLEKNDIRYTTIACDDYPLMLKEIGSPPAVLFYKGDLTCLSQQCLAIVGSRKNSAYASYQTEKFVKEFSRLTPNVTIVSGLAYGIDSVAHHSALKFSLKTAAVLGSGLLRIYPASNKGLAAQILRDGGCLLTELPCSAEPLGVHFPLRNRIISGLSRAVLVMEAGEKSGSLITAKYALENNRDVFALPGQVDYPSFLGTNRLIQRAQAILLTSAKDVVGELTYAAQTQLFDGKKNDAANRKTVNSANIELDDVQRQILSMLEKEAIHEEIIGETIDISFPDLLVKLTTLELAGIISRTGSGQWKKTGYGLSHGNE